MAVYDLATDALSSGSLTMTFRYDDAAVAAVAVAEGDLRVYSYNGSLWDDITASVDTGAKTITANSVTGGGLFAVGLIPACVPCEDFLAPVIDALCSVAPASALQDWHNSVVALIASTVTDDVCVAVAPGAGGEAACEAYLQSVILNDAVCQAVQQILGQ